MQSKFSRRTKWLVALVQAALLLMTMVMPAAAADPAPLSNTDLVLMLRSYGVVKGDENGNLLLDKPISRAEMITIMVRALNGESQAEAYRGVHVFPDARDHWAQHTITYASIQKLVKGDDKGNVRPKDPISWAEALTLVLRVVKQEPATGEWPINVLLSASSLGLVPDGVNYSNIMQPATRGEIFASLGKAITTVKTPEGKTYLQAYLDATPPVLSVTRPAATTNDTAVRVNGTAQGAQSVTVNGNAVQLIGNAFSANVSLNYGANQISVVATDYAGNTAVDNFTVTRALPVATMEITGPDKVRPGGTVTYVITAKDSNGRVVGLDGVTSSVSGNIGTFDLKTGVFTASSTPAKGKITLTAGTLTKTIDVEVMGLNTSANRLMIRQVNDGKAVSYTKPMTVQVEVRDALGTFLNTDFGRPVTLTASGMTGLQVSPAIAYTEAGVATFTVRASAMGTATLQAASGQLTGDARIADFGSNLRVRLTADPSNLEVGGVTTISRIRATLVDENGNAVANQTGNDIIVNVTAAGGNGVITDSFLRIPRGYYNSTQSGDEGAYSIGSIAGTTTVTGTLPSGQVINVDPVTITTTVPTLGGGNYWDLLGGNNRTPNSASTISIRLASSTGGTIPGSYAFQLKVETSNNEPKQANGLPQGVTLTLGSGLNPISDGIAEGALNDGNDVIVRTAAGVATFNINYNKPGNVYVTVIPAPTTSVAYASDNNPGVAIGTEAVPQKTFTITYAGVATNVRLEVDSALGNRLSMGAQANATNRAFTLRAVLTDATGNWIPNGTGTVTLTRVSGTFTTPPTFLSATAVNGEATFTVYATGNPGEDFYQVSVAGITTPTSNSVSLKVQNAVPSTPVVLATRGVNNGIPGALNYVAPTDTGLEVELARDTNQQWVVAKVYREGWSTPIYASEPINMSDFAPRIVVPKSALTNGIFKYQVTLANGYGESGRSVVTNQITNAIQVSNISLSSAKYNRTSQTLIIYGSGFGSSLDTVNPALITVADTSTGRSVTLAGARITVNGYSQLTAELAGTTAATDLVNPAFFSGNDVLITTFAGWYTRSNGEQSAAITTGAIVGPMAHIRHVVYDRTNSRLTVVGQGFNTGNINPAKLVLQATGGSDILLSSFTNYRQDDSTWVFTINSPTVTTLDANGTYALNAQDGWFYDSSWTQGPLNNLTIYTQVAVSSINYNRTDHKLTITGSGFTGASVSVASLKVTDLSTTQTVTLTGAPTVEGDTSIVIDLLDTSYTDLETYSLFEGSDIFLLGNAGWLTVGGRQAAELPSRVYRLPTQTQP